MTSFSKIWYNYQVTGNHESGASHAYGQRPPEIGGRAFELGWLQGVRRIASSAAKASHWHSHPECTILFCLRGEFTYEFKDRSPITLTAGSYMAFPSGMVHRHAQAIDPIGLRIEMLVNPKPPANSRYGLFSRKVTCECLGNVFDLALTARTCPKPVIAALRGLEPLAECGERQLSSTDCAQARLFASAILLGISGATPPATAAAQPVSMSMSELDQWLSAHLSEKLDTARIVSHIGYSRTHVFSLFHKHTGLTPADYLQRMRVKRAQQLLGSTDMSAREVAAECGFSSPSVFNTVFRRLTGTTPLSWRGQVHRP